MYLCDKCGKWHLNLSGGYALTSGGAVATCFHVVNPGPGMREGCLVAVDEQETVLPVVEVLAANHDSDACIVRVPGSRLRPLPLNTNVYPGDTAYCYSDPAQHRDYFSAGIVNRFYQLACRRHPAPVPLRAARSRGLTSAPIGRRARAVPQSLMIAATPLAMSSASQPCPTSPPPRAQNSQAEKPAAMVFHEAVSARDVLLLTRPRR